MSFIPDWYWDVFTKYVVFRGRASRKQFWKFCRVHLVIGLVLLMVEPLLYGTVTGMLPAAFLVIWAGLPGISLAVRRLHDIGWSGWWVLIVLVPFVNFLLPLLLLKDSQPGDNRYGPSPLPAAAESP